MSIFEYFHIFIYSTNWLIHSFNFLSLFFHFDQFESIQAPLKRKTSQLIQTRHRMHHRQRLKRIQANQLRAAHLIKMVSKLTTASIEEHVKVSCFAPLYGALTYLPTHTRTHANTHTAKEACTHTRVFLFFFRFLLLFFVHRRGISVSVYQTSSCAVMLLLLFFLSLGVCAYAFAFVYVVISSLLFMVLSFVRFVLLHAFCRMRFYFCLSFV